MKDRPKTIVGKKHEMSEQDLLFSVTWVRLVSSDDESASRSLLLDQNLSMDVSCQTTWPYHRYPYVSSYELAIEIQPRQSSNALFGAVYNVLSSTCSLKSTSEEDLLRRARQCVIACD